MEEDVITAPIYDLEIETGTIISPIVMTRKAWEAAKEKRLYFYYNVMKDGVFAVMEEDIKRDIVNYRRQKACDLMHDVDVLIDNELWNSAVNRMYYACFHMVSALLILHGIEVKSHMGVRQAFGLHFVKTNLLSSECGRIFSKNLR